VGLHGLLDLVTVVLDGGGSLTSKGIYLLLTWKSPGNDRVTNALMRFYGSVSIRREGFLNA